MNAQPAVTVSGDGPLAIICGGGSLPFAVADAAIRNGRRVVLFPLKGAADEKRVAGYPHYWMRMGQAGRFRRAALAEGCRDVVFIGTVVRPRLSQLWPDFFTTTHVLPRLIGLFRGGDDRLLTGISEMFQEQGFRTLGVNQVAPEVLMPLGLLGRHAPGERDRKDIATGLSLLRTLGPFDVGQAVVVCDQRILAIEAADGTDAMLAHLADMRRRGRIRSSEGAGVLIKAPKPNQDRRLDLPSIGPSTVQNAQAAGLGGIAVVAGSTVVAEPADIAQAADKSNLFVIGIEAETSG